MFRINPWLLIIFLIPLWGGCSGSSRDIESFMDRIPQESAERIVLSEISLETVRNMTGFEVFNAPRPKLIQGRLMWIDYRNGVLVSLDPDNPEQVEAIGNGPGDGPGEVERIGGFALHENQLVVIDSRLLKIMQWNYPGGELITENTIEEYRPDHLVSLGNGRFVTSSYSQDSALFYVIDASGKPVASAADSSSHVEHPMQTSGYLTSGEDAFFFAGYSEPMIRKYNRDGELLFSRALIKNFDTSEQYTERSFEGGGTAWGFSEDARFSALHVQYHAGYIFVAVYHNDQEGDHFIDIYDSENGDYTGSWLLDQFAPGFAIGEKRLYGFYMEGDEVMLGSAGIELP